MYKWPLKRCVCVVWVMYSYRDSMVKVMCGIYLFVFKINKTLAFHRLLVMSLSRRSGSRLWSNELLARTLTLTLPAFRSVCRCQRQSMKSGNQHRGRRNELCISAWIRAGRTGQRSYQSARLDMRTQGPAALQ